MGNWDVQRGILENQGFSTPGKNWRVDLGVDIPGNQVKRVSGI